MKTSLLGLMFLCAAAPEAGKKPPAPPKSTDLTGYYACIGGKAGKEYRGIVSLHKAQDAYVAIWSLAGASFTGVGVVKEGRLYLGWTGGLGIYRVDGKTLSGEVVAMPGLIPYRETWTYIRELEQPKAEDDL